MGVDDFNNNWMVQQKLKVFYDELSEEEEVLLIKQLHLSKGLKFAKERYMRSRWWRRIRQEILERDNWQCVRCKSLYELQVHHKIYRGFGEERPEDLETLCRTCHQVKSKCFYLGKGRPQFKGDGHLYKELRT